MGEGSWIPRHRTDGLTGTRVDADTIRSLTEASPADRVVVSLYLDVDGKRWPKYKDCEARAERLVRFARGNGHTAATKDLERVEAFVKGGVDRSTTRGLAVFSGGPDFWHVFELPVPVHDQLVVNDSPHVHQLEAVVATHERFGVLLVDRQRARMFVFDMGQMIEASERFDALPRHDDDAGARDRRHDKHKLEAAATQHLKRSAEVAFEVYRQHPFDHLIVGAPDDVSREIETDLHPWLRERIAARLHLPITASAADVRDAALRVEEEIERRAEAALVARVRDGAGAGSGAAVGLAPVLDALGARRVDTLVISSGYEAPGWSCAACDRLADKGPTCSACDGRMERADDVVEKAIESALRHRARVKVCIGNADLDVAGRIGALLRY
jgi:peptide chain release factor subunit 1